jgi:anti-sigma B factor antagonist
MSTMPVDVPIPRLSLKTYTAEGSTIVECSGRLSIEGTPQLKREVKDLIARGRRIVLDLSGLTYMDSSGLGAIVGLYVSAKTASCEFRLINLNKQVREMLRITNLLTMFEACGQYVMKIP